MTVAVNIIEGIPALPIAVAKVLEETGRDEPDPRVIARAIESDAGLAAKMLSLVNSPYYGLNGTVTALNQAIMIVGMRQVRNVALAVGALRSIPGIPPAVVDAFLERSMMAAKTARALAMKGGLSAADADTAHLGGLLRGVGSLVALRMRKTRPTDVEIAQFARVVLEHWKLPAPIVAAAGESAGPFPEGAPATPAYAVYVASMVIAGRTAEIDDHALASLNISSASLASYEVLSK